MSSKSTKRSIVRRGTADRATRGFSTTEGTGETKKLLNTTHDTKAVVDSPQQKPRFCMSDPVCLVIFIVCCGCLGWLMFDAVKNGDPRRLYHVRNYEGQLCGVDLPQKPFGYWCTNPGVGAISENSTILAKIGLDLYHPICLEACPTTDYGTSECYDPSNGGTRAVKDYATHAVAGRYCLPQPDNLPGKGLLSSVTDAYDHDKLAEYLEEAVANIKKGWKVLLIGLGMAFVLSYLYIVLLECIPGCVIYSALLVAFVISLASGIYILCTIFNGDGLDGVPGTGDGSPFDVGAIIGFLLVFMAAFILCFYCRKRQAISTCVKATETTAVMLTHSPTLFLEPVLNLVGRICIWIAMMVGFAYLMSTMEAGSDVVHTFKIPWYKALAIGFYIFMCIWLNEICTTMSQFVISVPAGRWYWTAHDPATGQKNVMNDRACGCNCCSLCSGYCNAIPYFGTIVLGAIIIALCRPVHFLIWIFSGCGLNLCHCCDWFIGYSSKTGIIDVATNIDYQDESCPNAYYWGSHDSYEVMKKIKKELRLKELDHFHGAVLVFTLLGMACVGVGCAALTIIILANTDPWNDTNSPNYIQDPACLAIIAGLIGAVVAWCFMIVFDVAWDALVLCMCYDLQDQMNSNGRDVELAAPPAQTGWFSSLTCSRAPPPKEAPEPPNVYCPAHMEEMFTGKPAGPLKNNTFGSFVNTSMRTIK